MSGTAFVLYDTKYQMIWPPSIKCLCDLRSRNDNNNTNNNSQLLSSYNVLGPTLSILHVFSHFTLATIGSTITIPILQMWG